MKDINIVKRHIKNLLNSHSLTKQELKQLMFDVARETIERQVDKLVKGQSLEERVSHYVREQTQIYINNALKSEYREYRSLTGTNDEPQRYIERLIRDECDKQVRVMIRENVSIKMKTVGD